LTHREPLLTSDGKHVLIVAGNDVRLHSAVTGDHLSTLSGHSAAVTSVVADPQNTRQVSYTGCSPSVPCPQTQADANCWPTTRYLSVLDVTMLCICSVALHV
jgi:hypothetical protein